VNPIEDSRYRLILAEGYLAKAERFFKEALWHDCVRDAQAAVENAGKSIVACFVPVEKTHEPAKQIRAMLDEGAFPEAVCEEVVRALTALGGLGWREHVLATYGDEESFTPPWDLFDRAQAADALDSARQSVSAARRVYEAMFQ